MNLLRSLAALLVATTILGSPAWAGEGHDHGDVAPATGGQALPRFSAVSETFELVGVLSGKQLTLYLDRFADNSPVRNAQIELEIGGAKFTAARQGEEEYEVVLPAAPKEGVVPVTATVTAGNEVDLLASELDIHTAAHAEETVHTHSRKEVAGWAVGGIAALALLAWGVRRAMSARSAGAGSAA
jgi:hypothetical protein